MVVQHNLRAMNSNRMLGLTSNVQSKSTEKLSSGYKINRAADDAAGLSISEKMRKQIRGLSQASLNASDGISAVQTAEGALNEVQDMLQRMNELSVKAANGTMSENDRSYIQNEIDQLTTEIDRVAETTKFNETYLLKGDKLAEKEWTANYTSAMTEPEFEKTNPYDQFYLAGETEALADDEAIANALAEGKKIYKNPLGQQESQDHSVNDDWKNASVSLDFGTNTWQTGGAIEFDTVQVAFGDAGTIAAVAAKFNDNQTFAENYEASVDGNKLVFTAKDNSVTGAAMKAALTKAEYKTTTNVDAADIATDDGVRIEYSDNGKGWGNLYAEGGTEALDPEVAKQMLLDGEKVYYGASTQKVSQDHTYIAAKGASVEIDLTGWTTGDTIKIDNVAYAQAANADAQAIADKLNATANFHEETGSYRASVSDDGKLIITANADSNKTSSDLASLFGTAANEVKVGTEDVYDTVIGNIQNAQAESFNDGGKGWGNLYAAGATEAVADADTAKQILRDGGKLYTNAAEQKQAVEGVDYNYTEPEEMAFYDVNGNKVSANALDDYFDFDNTGAANLKEGKKLYIDKEGTEFDADVHNIEDYVGTTQTKTVGLDISLHVGADATEDNQITMKIEAMDSTTLGVNKLKVDGADDGNALNAIETIKAALQKVSTQRSALGAVQNRLEHTIANLDNVVENTTAAESQIRDTDMATEMVKFSNNNILAQAGQAMLAQANQANQGVLSLLG